MRGLFIGRPLFKGLFCLSGLRFLCRADVIRCELPRLPLYEGVLVASSAGSAVMIGLILLI